MKTSRLVRTSALALATAGALGLYLVHGASGSDHQDTYDLGNTVGHNTTADLTDVYVFPSPSNPNDVVLAMDVAPLTPAGMGLATRYMFDPTLLWQFKISHSASGREDQVIQFTATAPSDGTQTIAIYGPGAPAEVSPNNTLLAQTGSAAFNTVATNLTLGGTTGASFFAGPRADPFNFDLFAFLSFFGDRNFQTHSAQSDAGPGTPSNGDDVGAAGQAAPAYDKDPSRASAPSFNGFRSGSMSTGDGSGTATNPTLGTYACSTNAAQNVFTDVGSGFDVESFALELPKSALEVNGVAKIHVWATVSSKTVSG